MTRNPGVDALAAEIFANMMARDPWQDARRAAEVAFLSASAFEVSRLTRTHGEAVVYLPREVVGWIVEALEAVPDALEVAETPEEALVEGNVRTVIEALKEAAK
jgi:uncharacterized protein YqcC (DUF446 family)